MSIGGEGGGNGFDAYGIARQIRASNANLTPALRRITITRAFTCYQVMALLTQYIPVAYPLLVMDLLATFSDQNVPQSERLRLLDQVIGCLLEASRLGPVAVSIVPTSDDACLSHLEARIGALDANRVRIWRYEAPHQPLPLALF